MLSLRLPELKQESQLRFPQDLRLELAETEEQLARRQNESQRDFALRLNKVVQQGIAHIDWDNPAMEKYHLRVPPWENYLLYAMSFVRPADYRKYHFSDPHLTVERGVGICGDAACVMSSLLEQEGIETRILAFPGHVIVEAQLGEATQETWLLDADFGVALPLTLAALQSPDRSFAGYYAAAGHDDAEIEVLANIYSKPPEVFADTFAFSPKRAIFEQTSYVLIWVLPALLLLAGVLGLRRREATSGNETSPTKC